LAPLAVLGGALAVIFIVATQEAVADVKPEDKGLASGIFETANHLLGGAVGVAVYAAVLTKAPDGGNYRAAFLTATMLVVTLGLAAAHQARGRTPSRV
jgi:predicted MFS family arabinose efflux permease